MEERLISACKCYQALPFINVSHYVSELGHTACGESILVILSRFLGMDGWMDG